LNKRFGQSLAESSSHIFGVAETTGSIRNRKRDSLGILIIGPIIQQPAVLGFSDSTPLLEEEWDMIVAALIPY
jgi:hypothetical protein